jgi:3-hydroxyisobutyrate dehydrogenase-like beta-hydroxyacid dehydrogenase
MATVVGVVHPGQMGVTVAASVKRGGNEVLWASEGRSESTRERASAAGLTDARSLSELCRRSAVVISICPPEFAARQAEEVLATGWRGLYVDANAISPEHVRIIAERMEARGADLVDGGIIGSPPVERGRSWLYLSGPRAAEAAAYFSEGPLEAEVLGPAIGRASALKMCFSAYAKGSTALLCALLAAAQRHGVLEDLKRSWTHNGPKLADVEREVSRAAPKAWRFVPEMSEIAATFEASGMPRGFHEAAAELYTALAGFKNCPEPDLDAVLERLARSPRSEPR